ncbi:MAG: hypothetical protein JWP69_2197 [Flaviaesturariibacter sp.]|nr:hypothetical protein [Flaviaesturariibacter sp.]
MEGNAPSNADTRAGTLGGTLLVLLVQIDPSELLKTGLLAATGATVSFAVSTGLKWLTRRWRKK